MKACMIVCVALAAYSVQSAQKESRDSAAALPRGISVDYSKVPWAKAPVSGDTAALQTIVGNVRDQLQTTLSDLAVLNENVTNLYQTTVENGYGFEPILAKDYSSLAAKDLSTLDSQNVSTLDSQNLSTSLAVPTALPYCPWGNGPRTVVQNTPGGEIFLTSYPPRTAWGNGVGVVATTSGGAVFSMVPSVDNSGKVLAVADGLTQVNRQLVVLQDDVARIQEGLENLKTMTNATGSPTPPPAYQPYLPPTGRQRSVR